MSEMSCGALMRRISWSVPSNSCTQTSAARGSGTSPVNASGSSSSASVIALGVGVGVGSVVAPGVGSTAAGDADGLGGELGRARLERHVVVGQVVDPGEHVAGAAVGQEDVALARRPSRSACPGSAFSASPSTTVIGADARRHLGAERVGAGQDGALGDAEADGEERCDEQHDRDHEAHGGISRERRQKTSQVTSPAPRGLGGDCARPPRGASPKRNLGGAISAVAVRLSRFPSPGRGAEEPFPIQPFLF